MFAAQWWSDVPLVLFTFYVAVAIYRLLQSRRPKHEAIAGRAEPVAKPLVSRHSTPTEDEVVACKKAIIAIHTVLAGKMGDAVRQAYVLIPGDENITDKIEQIPLINESLRQARMALQKMEEEHRLALRIISVDLGAFWHSLSQLEHGLARLEAARDWPVDAIYEKASDVSEAVNRTDALRKGLCTQLSDVREALS